MTVDGTAPAPVITTAEIIAVGSELLTPWRVDTNSLFVTSKLDELGIEVLGKRVVPDDRDAIAGALREGLRRAGLVVTTGGLGPTADDLTREVAAEVLGRALHRDEAIERVMRERFESRGWRMPEVNRRQAMVPEGATVLENRFGTAPGLWLEQGHAVVLLLPGPPRELNPMLEALVIGRLADRAGRDRRYRRLLRVAGRPESDVEQVAAPVYSAWTADEVPIETTILASPGMIELHLTARGASEADATRRLDAAADELRAALGDDLFSDDGRTLEQVVGDRLRSAGATIAAAESCTGGLLMSRLTDVPGSSDYVVLGVVAYTNEAKIDLVSVPGPTIERHGAVSEPVASALARGVRQRAGADVGVGVTGVAGPGGGSARKPVGTVSIAVDGPGDAHAVRTARFPGGREQVKRQATEAALDMVRRALDARR